MGATAGDFDPIDFLERAVRTPSHETPDAMRDLLRETLDAHGVDPRVDDGGNVLGSRGAGRPHVVLNTHIDTVPPHVPFGRETAGGEDRIVGRGACDAKGPLAAFTAALLRFDPESGGGAGRVTLAVTPDEETASTGAAALVDDPTGPFGGPVDGVIVGEPTGLDVCTAARGRIEGVVGLEGTSAHAATPGDGRNAVRAAVPVLRALDGFDGERGPGPHDQLGAPSLTATRIHGGGAANQVPADCTVRFDRRSVPPETVDGFRESLSRHVRAAAPDGIGATVELADRDTPFFEAFATPEDAPLVRALCAASGGDARPFGAATEASYFAPHAPTVVFGPGTLSDAEGPVAHAEREYVPVAAVRDAAAAVAATLRSADLV
jgi:acetylornithine deacetylase